MSPREFKMKTYFLFAYSLLLTLFFYPQDLFAEGKNDYGKVLLWGDLHVHSNFSFDAYSFASSMLFTSGVCQSHLSMFKKFAK